MENSQLKLRAWDKQSKVFRKVKCIDFEGILIRKGEPSYIEKENDGCYLLKDSVIEQFTGLKDKNSVEVFAGDIVEYHDITSDQYLIGQLGKTGIKTIGSINWIKQMCKFAPQEIKVNSKGGNCITHWDFIKDLIIIGNIHEHKHLLEEGL